MMEDLVLNDRYRLIKRLAAGGMGEVWRATDETLARPVAVKLLRQEHVSDQTARIRFQAEARFAAALQHGGIAQVYDYGEQDERVYLVMELVPGEPLSKILRRDGPRPADVTLDLVAQAARALQVAHTTGIIHRDVKPANLMVTDEGTLKITDFGIARGLDVATVTQTGMVMGTAHYISPEQASGKQITPATDLYSLGVVAYECLVGHPPFQADTPVAIALKHVREAPPELPAELPHPVRELVGALLAKNPDDRPGSAREVAEQAFVIRDTSELAVGGYETPTEHDPAGRRPGVRRPGLAAGFGSGAGSEFGSGSGSGSDAGSGSGAGSGYEAGSGSGGPAAGGSRRVRRPRPAGRSRAAAGALPGPPGGADPETRRVAMPAAGGARPGEAHLADGAAPDTLASDEVTGRRRSVILLGVVAAGVLLLGAIVAISLVRGSGSADLVRDKQPPQPAVGDPGSTRQPVFPAPSTEEPAPTQAPQRPPVTRPTTTSPSTKTSFSEEPTTSPTATKTPTGPTPTPTSTTPTPPTGKAP